MPELLLRVAARRGWYRCGRLAFAAEHYRLARAQIGLPLFLAAAWVLFLGALLPLNRPAFEGSAWAALRTCSLP